MKIIHMSDLHLGKRVNEFPMTDDQRYILERVIDVTETERPDAFIIAGDIYDKPDPPAEAVQLFDDFLCRLADLGMDIFIISGNHDSAERLSFGARIMSRRGVHLAGGYDGKVHKVTLNDEFGKINFYLLPFLKPVHVRALIDREYPADQEKPVIKTFNDAVRFAVDRLNIDKSERNVMIAHQFVTGSKRCDSEEISVGGLDNVDASVFDGIDYTALGHLHGPQYAASAATGTVRYCGSPLKYSFSEADQEKSLTIVEIGQKYNRTCDVDIRTAELVPYRDLRVLRGSFNDLTDNFYYKDIKKDDYMRIVLTDEDDVIGALADLRIIYPNIMRLEYDNTRTRAASIMPDASDTDSRTPLEVFASLYEAQNGKAMDEKQTMLITEMINKVWSEEK